MIDKQFIHNFFTQNKLSLVENYLCAVSGGRDSMVMLHSLFQSGIKIQVAHINYQLRAKESNSEMKLVQDFCTQHNIPFHGLKTNKEKILEIDSNFQKAARVFRYNYFEKICKKH